MADSLRRRTRRAACTAALFTCCACGQPQRPDSPPATLPKGPPATQFAPQAIGDPPQGRARPQLAHVQPVDLDADGLLDVVVSDGRLNRVTWIRQAPAGTFTEREIAKVLAPANAEPVDMDRDGDLDLVMASLGVLFPDNRRIGAVIVLENDRGQRFTPRTVAEHLTRVADVRAGDLDGDGDLDLAVAGFGYDQGETLWLENAGGWRFTPHPLQSQSGPINALIADINADRSLDIVALVSQEWEEIWAFVNDGKGHFTNRLLWGSTNPDFGSSWMTMADLDKDGDPDFVHSNGDAFDYAPANSRPWHGVQWLENRGGLSFASHRIADFSGASSPQVGDVDGDGDLDVVVVSAYNRWADPAARSLAWLENNGRQQFTLHDIASAPTHLITLGLADFDANGTLDFVTGGMHIAPPYDRMARVTLWPNQGFARSR